MRRIVLIITATTAALIAGLLYAYACSVNPGLGKLNDVQYIAAMKSINIQIQNPVFFASFLGTFFLLPLSAVLHFGKPVSRKFLLLVAASVVYVIGVIGITFAGNIPLNDMLHRFDLAGASPVLIKEMRLKYEGPWNQLHIVRTAAAVLSLVLVLSAITRPSQNVQVKNTH